MQWCQMHAGAPATHSCSGVLACLLVPAGPPASPLSALTTNLLEAVGVLRAAPEGHEGRVWRVATGASRLGHVADRKQQALGCLTQMLLPCWSTAEWQCPLVVFWTRLPIKLLLLPIA